MANNERNQDNQCWTRYRKDGSTYRICEGQDGGGRNPLTERARQLEALVRKNKELEQKRLEENRKQQQEPSSTSSKSSGQTPPTPAPHPLSKHDQDLEALVQKRRELEQKKLEEARKQEPLSTKNQSFDQNTPTPTREPMGEYDQMLGIMELNNSEQKRLEEQKNPSDETKLWQVKQKQDEEEKAKYGPNRDTYRLPANLDTPPRYLDEIRENIKTTQESVKGTPEDPTNWFEKRETERAWIEKVSPGGEWDYKVSRRDYPAEERERAGNFNYGATCVAAGFDPDFCLRMGGLVQWKTDNYNYPEYRPGRPFYPKGIDSCYGDAPDDCMNVLNGIRFGFEELEKLSNKL